MIEAASPQARAAGNYKGGFGFHPMTSWCSNTGDAMMGRPGNAARSPQPITSRSLTRRSPKSLPSAKSNAAGET